MARYMGTAATEAIRIAEKYLPQASLKRQKELAMKIVEATNLCEAEFAQELTDDLVTKLSAMIGNEYGPRIYTSPCH